MIFLLFLILFIQYILVSMDVIFAETTKTRLKRDIIPFYGLYVKLMRVIDKLPK